MRPTDVVGRDQQIASITAERLDVRMKKPFGIAGGAQAEAKNVLVEVALGCGIYGWGEGAPFPAFNGETQEAALAACALAAPLLGGCSVHDSDSIAERVRDACRGSPSAICAIETAILDARAKLASMSLRTVLGGAQEELVTDVTITTGTVEDARSEAIAFREFRTLKIKVGGSDLDNDIARVRAVRSARSDARLLIDANGGFTVDEAIRFAIGVTSVDVRLFEQPIAPGNWEALAEVRKRTGLPIAIDESLTCANDVVLANRHDAVDAINVKIMKSGIFETLAIIKTARELGLDRMIGGMVETRLAMGMSACIAAGIGGFKFIDLDTPLFLAEDPMTGGYTQEGQLIDLRSIEAGHGAIPRSRSKPAMDRVP
jgi:L-alanine-DL-glutamate epimerase-like enolase superfamily enzyme